MKSTILTFTAATAIAVSCSTKTETMTNQTDFQWQIDQFDDINILRYRVEGFDSLPLEQKKFIYYMSQAALTGRDILFDQNFRYNLPIRRTLEAIYRDYSGPREGEQWEGFVTYLKKVWFANGIHHHYSGDKFTPAFSAEYFDTLLAATPTDKLPADTEMGTLRNIIFDPALYARRVDQSEGIDMVTASACNYYYGVTQGQAEQFYTRMAEADPNRNTPISYGLNSQLVSENGVLKERVWCADGMYGAAIRENIKWLELAREVACNDEQRAQIDALISFNRTGDLREFDRFNVLWVQDTLSNVDFVNGFTETYGDPLGYKASWESNVNFRDPEATKTTEIIGLNAQWFEDNSPIPATYRKPQVKGVSAKVITVAMLGGDCYPATPIGINLPNADWIRRDYGSKSVTINNITEAYGKASGGNGFTEEFVLRPEDRELKALWGSTGSNLHTDLHECLGHGSGQLAPGVKGDELKNYGSPLEEARADLFALYYIADPKMVELGIMPSLDVARAEYNTYMLNGLMTQITRIEPGKNIEQAHMRNRALIANRVAEQSRIKATANNTKPAVEIIKQDGKSYVVINDYDALRGLFGELLHEIQRIKSEGDYAAGRALVENYGVKIDPKLHREVLDRYAKLGIAPYSGFVNPRYMPLFGDSGEITDITIEYPTDYAAQMLDYSANYSFLPNKN